MPRTSWARSCSTVSSAALVFMPVTVVVLGGVDRAQAGTVSGLLQTSQQLGGAVGLAAIVSVYASGSVPGQFVPGVEPAFLTSATFTLVALLVAAVVLRPRPAPGADRGRARADARDGRRRRSGRRRGELTASSGMKRRMVLRPVGSSPRRTRHLLPHRPESIQPSHA